MSNSKAVRHDEIVNRFQRDKSVETKEVRKSLAVKEHVWRIGKRWLETEGETPIEPQPQSKEYEEPMVPKRLYDEL